MEVGVPAFVWGSGRDHALRSRKEFVKTLARCLESNSTLLSLFGRRIARRPLFLGGALSLMLMAASLLTSQPVRANETLAEPLPLVISAGADHDIKKWDGNGKLAATLGSHDDAVNALLLLGSDSLASVGADGVCKFWSISDNRMSSHIDAVKGSALSVAVTSDMKILAIGTAGGQIALFAKATGKKLGEVVAHENGVRALRFSADGTTLLSASSDLQLRFWRVTIGGKAPLDYQSNVLAGDDAVNGMVLSPDDKTIATISSDGFLKTWQRTGSAFIKRVKVCNHGAAAVAFSPDGRTIATGDEDGHVRLWNATTLDAISTLGSHDRAVTCLAWSANGKFVVSGGADKTLRYWSLDQGKEVTRITAHDGTVKAVVVLP